MKKHFRGQDFYMFYGGPLSNWYPSKFKVGNVIYNCAEQWMMHQKALLFDDIKTASNILLTDEPAKQKKFGRSVVNYDDSIWSDKRYEIVKRGLNAKFRQNKELQGYLLGLTGYTIVEASPTDSIWGIGYGINHPKLFFEMGKWGQNLLGKCLESVRDTIYNEQSVIW